MNSKNFLGIDWGSKHYGVADSDGFIEKIAKLVEENSIETIVVGIPESKVFGEKQKDKIENFIREIKIRLPKVEIEKADEKMTTKLVNRYASKSKEHQEAARIILEDWLFKKKLAKFRG